MCEVSIIVPVYNAEKAIRRCVESVLSQEFTDFELILIDDGSKDSSPAILDEYAEKDSRVQVIHKANSGVSATRNLGIEKARGKYIQFMDADDWIPADSTKLLHRAMTAEEADLTVGGFYRVVGERFAVMNTIGTDCTLDLKQYSSLMMENPADYYYGVLWNKLYRADLIRENNVRMNEDLSFCEDFVFNLDYLVHTGKIHALNVPVYYYVKTEGSLVSQNMNPVRLVQMKTNIYSYYSRYFKDILGEEEYSADRLAIGSFLFAAAGDEFVLPVGSKKLGEEKVSASFEDDGSIVLNYYYERKLYERFLAPIAMKYNLTMAEIRAVLAADLSAGGAAAADIAGFTGANEINTRGTIEMLKFKGVVSETFDTEKNKTLIRVTDARIHKDLADAQEDFLEAALKGMSEEEKAQLKTLLTKYGQNIREALKAYAAS